MNKFKIISCCTALSLVMLTACGKGSTSERIDSDDTTVTDSETAFTESETTSLSETETADTNSEDKPASGEEASAINTSEMLSQMINRSKLPEISITDSSSHDEIMQAGKRAAVFFAEAADKYFGYGVERRWKLSQTDDDILAMEEMTQYQTSGSYWRSLGLYTETGDAYIPLDGAESKQFLIDCLHLTEKGYDDLCANSPSTYTINDDSFYVSSGDGGEAGWSYSRIVDYSADGSVITFNCERVGDAEDWGYDEDMIQPFTFSLAFEDDAWKLDGVYYGEGFFKFRPQEYAVTDEEKQQIQTLLKESGQFFYDYINCKEICKHTDTNKTVTTQEIADNGMYEGEAHDRTWYEVTGGDVTSLDALNEKMGKLFTENMTADLDTAIDKNYHEENGKLYLSDNAGSDGGLLGTDTVYIKSVGKADDMFVLYMTAFGAGENWELDYDLTEDFTVLLKKTDNGFKVDECGLNAQAYIEWCYTPENDMI